MAYKTARNRALADEWRLITAKEEDGTTWYAPDGHFATTYPIYDGYKTKKAQEVVGTHPNMSVILNDIDKDEYIPAHQKEGGLDHRGTAYTIIEDDETSSVHEWVADRYVALFNELYPNAELLINAQRSSRAVKVVLNGELVGLIMPLKSQR